MNVAQRKSLQIIKKVYLKGVGKLGSCCGLCCLIIQVTGLSGPLVKHNGSFGHQLVSHYINATPAIPLA